MVKFNTLTLEVKLSMFKVFTADIHLKIGSTTWNLNYAHTLSEQQKSSKHAVNKVIFMSLIKVESNFFPRCFTFMIRNAMTKVSAFTSDRQK